MHLSMRGFIIWYVSNRNERRTTLLPGTQNVLSVMYRQNDSNFFQQILLVIDVVVHYNYTEAVMQLF